MKLYKNSWSPYKLPGWAPTSSFLLAWLTTFVLVFRFLPPFWKWLISCQNDSRQYRRPALLRVTLIIPGRPQHSSGLAASCFYFYMVIHQETSWISIQNRVVEILDTGLKWVAWAQPLPIELGHLQFTDYVRPFWVRFWSRFTKTVQMLLKAPHVLCDDLKNSVCRGLTIVQYKIGNNYGFKQQLKWGSFNIITYYLMWFFIHIATPSVLYHIY